MYSFDEIIITQFLFSVGGFFIALFFNNKIKDKSSKVRIFICIIVFLSLIILTVFLAFHFHWESDILGIHKNNTDEIISTPETLPSPETFTSNANNENTNFENMTILQKLTPFGNINWFFIIYGYILIGSSIISIFILPFLKGDLLEKLLSEVFYIFNVIILIFLFTLKLNLHILWFYVLVWFLMFSIITVSIENYTKFREITDRNKELSGGAFLIQHEKLEEAKTDISINIIIIICFLMPVIAYLIIYLNKF